MKGEKHKQKTPPDPAASKQKTLFASASDPTEGTTTERGNKKERQHTLDTAILSEGTVKAEIIWSLEVSKNKYSYWSYESKSSLFAEMFKDSKIAQCHLVWWNVQ